jgi:hypothetical protein
MAGHFIGAMNCCHHITTEVDGEYLVSTVGCYHPNHTRTPDGAVETVDIGYKRKFETMVFRLGSLGIANMDLTEIDMEGYNDAEAADDGHERMCQKWESK